MAVATWAIGDVQGCFGAFRELLDRIDYRRGRDRIWLVGDLVNRGPDSLGMLRWARDQGDSVRMVLGNHDLHLLAQHAGVSDARKSDTLGPVLRDPEADDLCDFVAARPFLHEEDGFVMVHAGWLPAWDLAEARRRAAAAREALAADRRGFLERLYAVRGDGRRAAAAEGAPADYAAEAASVLTRVRLVGRSGEPEYSFDRPPEAAPEGSAPWFARVRLPEDRTVLFGHWAALGLYVGERVVGLDSGCVWGGWLTAYRLEDGALRFARPAAGEARRPG